MLPAREGVTGCHLETTVLVVLGVEGARRLSGSQGSKHGRGVCVCVVISLELTRIVVVRGAGGLPEAIILRVRSHVCAAPAILTQNQSLLAYSCWWAHGHCKLQPQFGQQVTVSHCFRRAHREYGASPPCGGDETVSDQAVHRGGASRLAVQVLACHATSTTRRVFHTSRG